MISPFLSPMRPMSRGSWTGYFSPSRRLARGVEGALEPTSKQTSGAHPDLLPARTERGRCRASAMYHAGPSRRGLTSRRPHCSESRHTVGVAIDPELTLPRLACATHQSVHALSGEN